MRFAYAATVGLMAVAVSAGPVAAASPYGLWVRPEDGATFRFSRCGGPNGLCIRVESPGRTADAGLIDALVFSRAAPVASNAWEGDVLDTRDGQTYSGRIALTGASSVRLEGCMLGGLICKSETWVRLR